MSADDGLDPNRTCLTDGCDNTPEDGQVVCRRCRLLVADRLIGKRTRRTR